MTTRLRYPEVAPDGYAALSGFGHYVNTSTALEAVLLGLVYLRASLLNGCTFCTEMHRAELRKHHEPESRIQAVAEPGSDVFTPRELAALRWTDVLTRLPSQGESATDEDYEAVERFFTGKDLVDLSFAIANINAWNRMGVAFRPQWRPRRGRGSQASAPAPSREDQGFAASQASGSFPEQSTGTRDVVDDDGGKVGEE